MDKRRRGSTGTKAETVTMAQENGEPETPEMRMFKSVVISDIQVLVSSSN